VNIELPRYTCRAYRRTSWSYAPRHGCIIRNAILKVFSALDTWQPTGGLTIEPNAYLPSESGRWLENHHFGDEYEDDGDEYEDDGDFVYHQMACGWVHGQQAEAPPASAILRLCSKLCLEL
ncbi:hypothetical protein M406DRAFT_222565, partial [Cryphonectria parasitica EP155]